MADTHIQWSEQAEYDLVTAGDMLKAGRLYYVLFWHGSKFTVSGFSSRGGSASGGTVKQI